MKFAIAIIFAITGCGAHQAAKPASSSLVPALRAKYASWISELKAQSDTSTFWPSASDCDATLWAGEAQAAGALTDVRLAEWHPGEIHRTPIGTPECYPARAPSTISQDMLAGYLWGIWTARDLGAAQRLWSYGKAHDWKMGQGDSRSILAPAGAGRLARLVASLGGPRDPIADIPDPCLPVGADYEHHLQVIGIALDGAMSSKVSGLCYSALEHDAKASPSDALFAAAHGVYSGDMGPALTLLLSDGYQCPT